jgi:hypothetical protein
VQPFDSFANGETPEWFREYSSLKHDRTELQRRMTLWKTTEALAALFLLSVYPVEMRGYLVDIGVIRSSILTTNVPLRGTEDELKAILMSHPFLLRKEVYRSMYGPIIAESQMLSFEFPEAVSPTNPMEKESSLESQWKASELRRKSEA